MGPVRECLIFLILFSRIGFRAKEHDIMRKKILFYEQHRFEYYEWDE
jgi:hypothetical protein